MSIQFNQVAEFNGELLGIKSRQLGEQPEQEVSLSITQLKEEIDEFEQAYKDKDFIAQIDAIIDLQYYLIITYRDTLRNP